MEVYEHNSVHLNGAQTEPPKKKRDVAMWVAVALLCVCVVLSVISLVLSLLPKDKGGEKPSTDASVEHTVAEAYAAVRDSVAEVYGNGGTGSGVVYKLADGNTYVISNYHVVRGASLADVRFTEYGSKINGKVIGYDDYHDIAVLEVSGEHGAKPVEAGDAPVVGTDVVAVGNSLGYGIAAFDGIVSHANRMLTIVRNRVVEKVVPVYAVTSPVNAGMSGGGIFGLDGKLLAIGTYQTNSVTESDNTERPVDGMSYGVPASIAVRLADRIIKDKSGAQTEKLNVQCNRVIDDEIDFPDLYFTARMTDDGFVVNGVTYGSEVPFEIGGGEILDGDKVTKIGGLEINSDTRFAAVFAECLRYRRGDAGSQNLEVTLMRGDKSITLTYKKLWLE